MPESERRDVAVVLSGGGINGVLLELGFLRRLSETALWPRIGWLYGTSAGALAGTMAALDRLDDLEKFVLGLRPEDAFRPRPIWQFPGGLHDYTLPATIAERMGPPLELGTALAASPIELLVYATDVTEYPEGDQERDFELEYSSHATEPETMGRAILASAAVSGIVLPLEVDGKIATDGGWVRNFPFEHAYRNPDVAAIAAFRYLPSYPVSDGAFLERARERLELLPRRASGASSAGRGPIGPRAGVTWRAGALRGADRAAHARRLRTERGRRGAARQRARDVGLRAEAAP